jgi:hypothetical protein
MEKDWVKILASSEVHYVNILKAMLEENGIPAFVLNQQDSLYPSVGEAVLHVDKGDVIKAKHLIEAQKS